MTADTPHARLAELAEQCENTDTGDGVMETPVERARQIGADLRAVLAHARTAAPEAEPASGDLAEQIAAVLWDVEGAARHPVNGPSFVIGPAEESCEITVSAADLARRIAARLATRDEGATGSADAGGDPR